jgi:phage-related protein
MAQERLTAIVGARIREFQRRMAEVNRTMRMTATRAVVEVEARTNRAQARLDRLAKTINSIQTVGSNMLLGGMMAMSPAAIPILAAVVASIAMLGPMVATLGASALALGFAFAIAGAAAAGFGAVAIPTIAKLFEENAKLNAQQEKAKKSFESFKSTWKGIVKELEKPVLEAFTTSMEIAKSVLKSIEPMFMNTANAVNGLLNSLKKEVGGEELQKFFRMVNAYAGPFTRTLGEAVGYLGKGLLNVVSTFIPLGFEMAKAFNSMAQRFSEWAAGLSKSEKFQSFVQYVQENMPKVRAIFRDAIVGIINTFAAFGPLAAEMMSGLQGMMSRFKEWSSTLKSNTAFQDFVGYIQSNGPKVITFIGELITFIANLVIGMAPLGAKILEIVTSFLSWSNSMMQAHPWIAKFVGGFVVFTGILRAIIPVILLTTSTFSGMGGLLARLFPMIGGVFSTFRLKLITGLRMLGQGALTFATTVGKAAGKFIMFIGKMLARAIVWAARLAAQWLIAMGPIGWITAAVIALVALIIWKWDEIKAATIRVWTAVWSFIKTLWNKIKSGIAQKVVEIYSNVRDTFQKVVAFLKGLGSTFFKAGVGLLEQMIKGIKSMVGKVTGAIKGVASKVRDFLPFSPAKDGPLSDIDKLNFHGPIVKSIKRGRDQVFSAMGSMLNPPELSLASTPMTRTPSQYDRNDESSQSSKNDNDKPQQVVVNIGGYEAKGVIKYITKEQEDAKGRKGEFR